MSGIGVVVNPRAGKNRRHRDRAVLLGSVVGRHGWVRETGSLEHLADVAEECRSRAVDLLGVCGGDGTLARTLSALVRAYGGEVLPRIVPLRAGTMNTVARAMGCPAWRPERMLAEIVATYSAGGRLDATEHQLLRVGSNDYGFMVGVGVPVEFLRLYYAQPQPGATAALRVLGALAGSVLRRDDVVERVFARVGAEVRCDGALLPCVAYSVIYASTIEEIGLGFRPTPRARERSGQFQIFAGEVGAAEFLRSMPAIRRGRPTELPHINTAVVSTLRVEFRQPTFYMVDGDIMDPATQLTVDPGPVVRVVRR